MQPLKYIFACAVIAACVLWEFACVCFRTFVLGHPLRQQNDEIEEGSP